MILRAILLSACLISPTMAQDLSTVPHTLDADIILLGETHDNPIHHLGQAEMIKRLNPKAVVFEMLSSEQAELVNADPRTDILGLGDRIGWPDTGWPDYALYRPIFDALGQTPVVGAGAPREEVRRAYKEGAYAVFGADGARFKLDEDLPKAQRKQREQEQFEAHCEAMPLSSMSGMVEAQRFRDARFSAATLAALEEYGAPIVVIAGNGHTRTDWAMPYMIVQASPKLKTYTIGFIEEPRSDMDVRFNHTVVTKAAERGDPCEAFKK